MDHMSLKIVPWDPLRQVFLQHASHENGVTSFLVDTSNYKKKKSEDKFKSIIIPLDKVAATNKKFEI